MSATETPPWRVKDDQGTDLIEFWKSCPNHSNEVAAAQIIERLEQELSAAKQDAERYRWIRDVNKHTHYGQNHIGGISPAEKLLMAVNRDPRLFECITCEIPLRHVLEGGELIWCRKEGDAPDAEPEHFDFAANMDAAIDAARGKSNGLED